MSATSTYTVQLDRPNATQPSVCWDVTIKDLIDGGAIGPECTTHQLYVPHLESWCPDTLRLVLYELSAYIPAHDPQEAIARVTAKLRVRPGRAPKVPRPPEFDDDVRLSVEARGWRAEVLTSHDDAPLKPGCIQKHPGWFTEPMQSFLLDVAANGPIRLASLRPEYSAPACERDQMPSRLNVTLGHEAPWDSVRKEWRDDIADSIERLRENLHRASHGGRCLRRLPEIEATGRELFNDQNE